MDGKRKILIGIVILLVILFLLVLFLENNENGDENSDDVFCTADAKICPDGSSVGRNPDNNCEFYECPSGS